MLNRMVPTPDQKVVCVAVLALMAKTSLSGRLNSTALSQVRPHVLPGQSLSCWQAQPALEPATQARSFQCVPSYLTTSPVSGCLSPLESVFGNGNPPLLKPPSGTAPSLMAVVRLPEWKTAAYTVLRSGLTASARGVSPNSTTGVPPTGVPPREVPRLVVSNTQTSARPMPEVVRSESGTPLFWPRCAHVMKARSTPPVPANTMSRGSSPTSNVCVTCGGLVLTSTMLTLSERWLTTHTSLLLRAATAIGSIPTDTDAT